MIITHSSVNARIEDSSSSLHEMAYIAPSAQYFGSRLADFGAARETIDRASFSEPNWDGDGALPISGEVKSNAITVLEMLESTFVPVPEISPNANGTLTFEWETDDGVSQFEIGKTRFSFYIRAHTTPAILCSGDTQRLNRTFGMIVNDLLYSRSSAAALVTNLTTNV